MLSAATAASPGGESTRRPSYFRASHKENVMTTDTRNGRLVRRVADLFASDQQFADAAPGAAINELINRPGVRVPQAVRTVMEGYGDRPALGQRAVRFVTGPDGRTAAELLPKFDTITYRQLWDRVTAVVRALTNDPVQPADRACILGFTSVDYTTVDMALLLMGSVSVPLTHAPVTQLTTIVDEAQPVVIACGLDYLDDAVELVLSGHRPARLVVFDHRPEVDDQREKLQAARARLAAADSPVIIETLQEVVERGAALPAVPMLLSDEDDPLMLLIYTSGSTGTPKGAMFPEHLVAKFWRPFSGLGKDEQLALLPLITLNFMPMSHGLGRNNLYQTLCNGGTAYFAAKSDLSTFLDDLAMVRPTLLNFVPRIWDIIFDEFQSEVDRRSEGGDRARVEAEVMAEQRQNVLGGRYVLAVTGSAPTTPEMKEWVGSFLDLDLVEGYGSTEQGVTVLNGQVRRPPVIDYKLADVPELGYFRTDRPHPRGELLIKSDQVFAGYYKRPELTAEMFDEDGFYRTGDIVVELGPDQLDYLDRRNNVLKLSQGEFVTVAKLEAVFERSPLVEQIYIYGNSARSYLLAVIVPAENALSGNDVNTLKPLISESLQDAAKTAGLQSYEIPRDFLLETTPFAVDNGLLTGVGKLARANLKRRYGERLEQLYADLAESQADELSALRQNGAERPVLETISRAAGALLGAVADVRPDAHFTEVGGDSLSALTFANLLHEIYDVDVPVGVIVSPASDLKAIAEYIEAERAGATKRPTFAAVHGRNATEVHARDLTLEEFIDAQTLQTARSLPGPGGQIRTILLTGATGFLGRYLALEWLERMSLVEGKLICLVRARSIEDARRRLDMTFDSGDPELLRRYRRLAAEHLEVLAGDKGDPHLGLEQQTWQRLADTVDLIVDPAALVNHVLPYSQLFGPNTLGTAELIRIALTTKLKPYVYVSTVGVGVGIEPGEFTEDADIRMISPTRKVDDSYANGYVNSKWAGEVLLREGYDLCALPVSVFRCDMILSEARYAGQLNLPDMFTRMMLSLVATGVAPGSFYVRGPDGNRQRAHYDGLPVDFIAEAISTLGERATDGFQTYNVVNPYDDGIGLDEYVDWLVDAGYPVHRIDDYDAWLQRFETALHALPEHLRQASVLPLLHNYQQPMPPIGGSVAPAERFRSTVQKLKVGPDKDIPHVTPQIIVKYITDLQLRGML
jgi:fatty acid CoA ligase FadD9